MAALALMALLGTAQDASAQLQVRLEQSGFPAVTISDNGPGDTDGLPGSIAFGLNGYGGFDLVSGGAVSKPQVGSGDTAHVTSSVVALSSGAGGTLVITVADTGFTSPSNPMTLNSTVGGTLNGPVSLSFQAWGNSNDLSPLTVVPSVIPPGSVGVSIGPLSSASFSGAATTPFTRGLGPYSIFTQATVSLAGAGLMSFGFDTTMTGAVVCTSALGDFVWNDVNQNGIQDAGEPGIPNITVQLWNSTQTTMLQSTTTDASGAYHFTGLCSDTYKVVVPSQAGLSSYLASPALQGGDAGKDSNPNPYTVFLPDNTVDNSIDFGYYLPAPHLTITKSPKNGTFSQGSQLTFSIVVGNDGGSPATNVHFHDQLPSNGGLLWTGFSTTQGSCLLTVGNLLDCDLGTLLPAAAATITVTSANPTPAAACQAQPNPQALATADGGLQAQDSGGFSCTPPPLACPAGSFTFSFDLNGNLNIVFDQFPAPNDNSYGINAVGWSGGHKFSELVGSDHAGFQLKDPNGIVKLNFNIDYLSANTSAPSGYASLGPFGGDGKVLVGTLTAADIAWTTSLARNLNNVNIPGLFNASHIQQFGSVNVLLNSPPTDALHQTYNNSDPLLAGWDFHNTYYVTISAAKLASLGFNAATWKVEPNLDALHNSPGKDCPPASGGAILSVTKTEVKDKQVKITIQNSGTVDEFITALQLTWPAANGKLMQVKLDGDVIYDNPDIAPPSANLTLAQLVADQNKRKIQHGSSDVLNLIFENNADPNLANYAGTISTTGSTLTILP